MKPPSSGEKTNPIQTQSKLVLSAVEWANFQKAKMNVNLTLTKDYRKKDDFIILYNIYVCVHFWHFGNWVCLFGL